MGRIKTPVSSTVRRLPGASQPCQHHRRSSSSCALDDLIRGLPRGSYRLTACRCDSSRPGCLCSASPIARQGRLPEQVSSPRRRAHPCSSSESTARLAEAPADIRLSTSSGVQSLRTMTSPRALLPPRRIALSSRRSALPLYSCGAGQISLPLMLLHAFCCRQIHERGVPASRIARSNGPHPPGTGMGNGGTVGWTRTIPVTA